MLILFIAGIVLFIGVCLWRVSVAKAERTTFWTGSILVATGLGLSLLFPAWISKLFANISPEQSQYLSNTFLIIASIGANLIAASLFMGSKENKLCSQCNQPISDGVTESTPENPQPTKQADLAVCQDNRQQ